MSLLLRSLLLASAAAGICAPALATVTLSGTVEDASGRPLRGATVTVGAVTATADARGKFELVPPSEGPIVVSVGRPGFASVSRALSRDELGREVRIVLEPAPVTEEIVVTARGSPARLGDTAASVIVVSGEELESAAAPTIDDALRQVPGFALFRRSGSRTANPTSQGVSLRGSGASGASRAIVLADGVPLNDPFGGWVYWGRVPRASLERIEVLRGGASDLWGSGALSGAIELVRREDGPPITLAVDASAGSERTREASLFSALRLGAWRASASGEGLTTDGYVPVEPRSRRAVDVEASSRRYAGDIAADRRDDSGRFFLRASVFDEDRENGTPLQTNDTRIAQVSFGGERRLARGALSMRGWASDQEYHQTFSAISADRSTERLTRLQEVPATSLGLSAQWTGSSGAHALAAGVEGTRVRGESREEIVSGAAPSFVTAGGEAVSGALFLEDVFAAGERVTLTGTLRLDSWQNRRGRRSTRDATGAGGIPAHFEDRNETAWSPRVSFLYRAGAAAALSASAYRSFRAPTLNELYRSFRVGSVETLANEKLDAERLTGAEAGAMLSPGRFFVRAVAFWMVIDDAIANVTVDSTPSLITRQRRNLGRLRSRGLELDLEARFGRDWKAAGGYLFSDSTVASASAASELVGLRTPQVARHQASLQLKYENPRVMTAAVQARWLGKQFDDDQNQLALDPFLVADLSLSRRLTPGVDAFVSAENVFDERYDVGRTPIRTIGPPRTLRAGLRLRLPRK